MAPVSITSGTWTNHIGRRGPFQEGNNLWIILYASAGRPIAIKSTDNGATWGTTYQGSYSDVSAVLDVIFDSTNGIFYVLTIAGNVLRVYSFTISNTTWTEVYDGSSNRPSIINDASGNAVAFFTRKSNGDFRVAYMANKSAMGSPYRNVYYMPLTAAGVWGSAVLVSAGTKLYHYDLKGAVLGASDRTHFMFTHGDTGDLSHRTLTSANVLGTRGVIFGTGSSTRYYGLIYDVSLAKLIAGMSDTSTNRVGRADSVDSPGGFTTDTGMPGSNGNQYIASSFVYDPASGKLYIFYRDNLTNGLYRNATTSTTWTFTDAVSFDGADQAQIYNSSQVGSIYGATGTQEMVAQSFQLTRDLILDSLDVSLDRIGSPTDNLRISIYSDSGDAPGTELASVEVAASTINQVGPFILNFTFSSPPSLSKNTKYWIVFSRTGARNTSDCIRVWGINTSAYDRGGLAIRDSGAWGGASSTNDIQFSVPKPRKTSALDVYLISDAIGIVYTIEGSSTVYFDKLVLAEPTPPVTANEEFFAFL